MLRGGSREASRRDSLPGRWGLVRRRSGDPTRATTKGATGIPVNDGVRTPEGEREKESSSGVPPLAQR